MLCWALILGLSFGGDVDEGLISKKFGLIEVVVKVFP